MLYFGIHSRRAAHPGGLGDGRRLSCHAAVVRSLIGAPPLRTDELANECVASRPASEKRCDEESHRFRKVQPTTVSNVYACSFFFFFLPP